MEIVGWPIAADTMFKAVLIHITELLVVKSITVTSVCILVWQTYAAPL